jgi:hypothetical protein
MAQIMAWKSAPVENRRYRLEKWISYPADLEYLLTRSLVGYATFRSYDRNKTLPGLSNPALRNRRLLGQIFTLTRCCEILRQALAHFTQVMPGYVFPSILNGTQAHYIWPSNRSRYCHNRLYPWGWVVTRPFGRFQPGETDILYLRSDKTWKRCRRPMSAVGGQD